MSSAGKPVKQGDVKRFCGKSWHNIFLALWPKKNEAEARLDIHTNESAFLSKINSGYPLQDASYFYVDEFSSVAWRPLGMDRHSIELISKDTEKVHFKFCVETKQEAMAWLDKLGDIFQQHRDDLANQTYGCFDSKEKIERGAVKFPVHVNNTTLGESLDLIGKSATVYIQGSQMILKVNKSNRTMSWIFSVVRRYKQKDESFVMEIGRRAESGAGVLHLVCNKADKLLECVSKATENMVRSTSRPSSARKGNDYSQLPGENKPSAPVLYEELALEPPPPYPQLCTGDTYERLN